MREADWVQRPRPSGYYAIGQSLVSSSSLGLGTGGAVELPGFWLAGAWRRQFFCRYAQTQTVQANHHGFDLLIGRPPIVFWQTRATKY